MLNRVIFYVDGFNLYNGIHDQWGTKHLWLDLVALAKSLRPHSELVVVRYFTASVMGNAAAQGRQDTYIDALKAHSGNSLDVVMGRYQAKKITCRACGNVRTSFEEKETDVNIAVRIVADAAADLADTFVIVSGDSDIAPAVRQASQANPKALFVAAFPPNRYSAELQRLMPKSFHIGNSKIAQAQLPQRVSIPSSAVTLSRPQKWT